MSKQCKEIRAINSIILLCNIVIRFILEKGNGSKMEHLLLLLLIPVFLVSSNMSAKGFVIEKSYVDTILDAKKKCGSSTVSCFSIGIKTGLIDGSQHRANNLGYSVVRGCNGEQSPNYCSGYIIGYSKAYGHQPNATEFYNIVNKLAFNKAREHEAPAPSNISCTASALFCNTYLHAYETAFQYNSHYRSGYVAGGKPR